MKAQRRILSRETLDPSSRDAGSSLIEVAISLALILAILLGVMAALSTGSLAQLNATEATTSQLLLSQAIEEVKNNDYDSLLSFNGQTVVSGTNTATILADLVSTDLTRIQVTVTSTAFPDVTSRAVILLANTN